MVKNSVLIVQESRDDKSLSDLLISEGFTVFLLDKADKLELQLQDKKPDLILLPVDLKNGNGIDLCHQLKQSEENKSFIILLSKRKEDFSLIAGLDSGADDFIVQPVQERVLLSRIKALLKRKKISEADWGDQALIIDKDRYLIIKQGKEFYLPKKEFEILSLLYSKPNKVFSREEIKNAIWDNFEKVRGRTVDVHIRKIREKIGDELISTVKGVGYRLEVN
ncbi:MAG: DNA-binding response regulator [Flavobacteriales bacterium]|nr:DNA-binding response regulator [Flavobacteriales bacterium]